MRRVFWWVVGIIVVIIVFCIGVKFGEFRDELRSAFGGSRYRAYPMMQYQTHSGFVSPAQPQAPTGTPGTLPTQANQ